MPNIYGPDALREAWQNGVIKPGDHVMLTSTITGEVVSMAIDGKIGITDKKHLPNHGIGITYVPVNAVGRVTLDDAPKYWPPRVGDVWCSNPSTAPSDDTSQERTWYVVIGKDGALQWLDPKTGARKVVAKSGYHNRADKDVNWHCVWRYAELERH